MNWITIDEFHFNLDQVIAFTHINGSLVISCADWRTPSTINDPDRRWYEHICNRVSLLPVEKEDKAHD